MNKRLIAISVLSNINNFHALIVKYNLLNVILNRCKVDCVVTLDARLIKIDINIKLEIVCLYLVAIRKTTLIHGADRRCNRDFLQFLALCLSQSQKNGNCYS